MKLTIGNKDLTFNTRLRTTIVIKKEFGKPYQQVIDDIENMDIMDLIKFCYCGLSEDDISKADFEDLILENYGVGDIYELIENFVKKLQYPNLSEEEIEKKLLEKQEKANRLKNQQSSTD